MLEPQTLLDYYASAIEAEEHRDGTPAPEATCWHASFDELRNGGLSGHTTREILLSYAALHEDTGFGERGVPIACCIRSLRHNDSGSIIPALLVRGTLDANGTLEAADDTGAWIPSELISGDECHNGIVSLCDIDAYCAHEVALAALPQANTWSAAIDRAVDLFDAVNTLDNDDLAALRLTLDTSDCLLFLWERPHERMATARLLSLLAQSLSIPAPESTSSSLDPVSGPVRKILCEEGVAKEKSAQDDEVLPDDPFIAQKVLCGLPDGLPAFEQADHAALASFAQQGHGDVMAVRTPLGTNRHAIALAAMANLLTEHALRGEKAPSMACVASCGSINRMLGLLSNRPVRGQAALAIRWIPRISVTGQKDSANTTQRRVLGSLGALATVHTADGLPQPSRGTYLTQPYSHPMGGDVALYGDAWYIPKASTYFLDCASSFLGDRIHTIGQARQRLSELLRHVDQERCELIDAYVSMCKASDMLRQRDNLVRRIGRLRRRHRQYRERFEYWEALLKDNPPRKPLFGKGEANQSALIAKYAQKDEALAQGKTLIEEVCHAYSDEVLSIEGKIDRLRGASANLARRIRSLAPEGERCSEIITHLSGLCHLSPEQASLLESSIDGRGHDVTMDLLDKVLDKTVRPAEFWMAIHIYESYWIEQNRRRSMLSHKLGGEEKGISALWSCLSPFSFFPQETALGSLDSWMGDNSRYDLVVSVDAHEMSDYRGLALATTAERMLVMGSSATLGIPATRGATFDELWTIERYGDEMWHDLEDAGLSLSSVSTLFDRVTALNGIPTLNLSDTSVPYGNLSDLRSDLIPAEPIRTNRTPATADDDPTYALRNVLPSLSYLLVPDSAWEQRGPSRQNRSETLALGRWLSNHLEEIIGCYTHTQDNPLALVAPFTAQAQLLETMLSDLDMPSSDRVDVLPLSKLEEQSWPVVVLCATCGPDSFSQVGKSGLSTVLNNAASAASDALMVACGSSWTRSTNEAATAFLARATCVGRLFSKPRKINTQVNGQPPVEGEVPLDVKLKPLAITALLKRLASRGDITKLPPATDVNKELQRKGLIQRVDTTSHNVGWRPTPAGHEVGIVSTKDSRGNPFCAYTPESEAVVASIVEAMDVP